MEESTHTTEPPPKDKPGSKDEKKPTRSALSSATALYVCLGVFHAFLMPRYRAVLEQLNQPMPELTLQIVDLPLMPVFVLMIVIAACLCLKELIPGLAFDRARMIDRVALMVALLLGTAYVVGLILPLQALS